MWNDLRIALRMLRKSPGFTAVAVLTLALGIGANTAIFSVADRLLVRSLPVQEPEKLMALGFEYREGPVIGYFNFPLFRDYQRGNTAFSHLTAVAERSVGLGTGGATERHRALLVSGNYFAMLGVNAALGRTFAQNEGIELDDAPVAVLSHGLWQRQFGADPQVIGRNVTVNGKPFTIIGVAPREFTGTTRGQIPDIYVPITMYGQLTSERPGGEHPLNTRYFMWHQIMGRLKENTSQAQAQTTMRALATSVHAVTPANTDTNILLMPAAQGFTQGVRDARLPIHLLMATAGLVLLIACANLANLQLVRAATRSREFAVRLALGARRGRLVRGLLTESVVTALLGGGLGIAVALWLTEVLNGFRPPEVSFELVSGLDARVLAFAFTASVLTGIIFGLAPAWRASRLELVPELKGTTASATSGRRWNLRSALVVTQVALSLLVLISAGLCLRSLKNMQQINPGFEPSRIALMSFDLELNNYDDAQAQDFFQRLLERTRLLPGVEAASLSMVTPLSGGSPGMSLEQVEGYQPTNERERPTGDINFVSPDYFRALGVTLLQGREFNETDTAAGQRVMVVDEAFARRYWPDQSALGRRVFTHGRPDPVEVVGVVRSTRNRRLTQEPHRTMFFPMTQMPSKGMTLVVRTGLEPGGTIASVRSIVKSMDANVPMFRVRTMEQQMSSAMAMQRMAASLLTGFGAVALALAALGIYGVLAYSVSRRTREIGVRMALGAQITDVLGMVLKQGLALIVVGMALGLGGAVAVTRLLSSFLYETKPLDPVTFVAVALLLAAVSLFACWLPARRAARVDPMKALRTE